MKDLKLRLLREKDAKEQHDKGRTIFSLAEVGDKDISIDMIQMSILKTATEFDPADLKQYANDTAMCNILMSSYCADMIDLIIRLYSQYSNKTLEDAKEHIFSWIDTLNNLQGSYDRLLVDLDRGVNNEQNKEVDNG